MSLTRLPLETDFDIEPEECLPIKKRRGVTLTKTPGIEKQLYALLDHAWQDGFTVMSNFAQANAEVVAMAASLQMITTRINRDVFSRTWQITAKGLSWLNEQKECT